MSRLFAILDQVAQRIRDPVLCASLARRDRATVCQYHHLALSRLGVVANCPLRLARATDPQPSVIFEHQT
jgi:hypothetical protein